jgi:magnesium-transporting ATPase (P-type)
VIVQSKDLFVDEAALTGGTYPVEKQSGLAPEGASLSQRTNTLFMGMHVVSGTATALVVYTGMMTEFGKISTSLRLRAPETEFEPFFKSKPGAPLWIATLLVIVATVILPYTELSWVFGFASMPAEFLLVLVGILVLYIIAAEMAKKLFYRKQKL